MISAKIAVRDLDKSLILLPERYDPRRSKADSGVSLSSIVRLSKLNLDPSILNEKVSVCLIETSTAQNGIVIGEKVVEPDSLKSQKRILEPGDVIISRLRPYLRQVAYVDEDVFRDRQFVLASTEFYVLRPADSELELAFLVPWLLSESVQKELNLGQEGGHHPRFNETTLLDLRIPQEIYESRRVESENVVSQSKKIRAALRALGTFAV